MSFVSIPAAFTIDDRYEVELLVKELPIWSILSESLVRLIFGRCSVSIYSGSVCAFIVIVNIKNTTKLMIFSFMFA